MKALKIENEDSITKDEGAAILQNTIQSFELTSNSGTSAVVNTNTGIEQAGQQYNGITSSGSIWNTYPYTWPYYQNYSYSSTDILVKKVENGWTVSKAGKTFIAKTEQELLKIIVKEEK